MQRLRALIEPRFASRDSPAAPDDGPRWAKGLRKPRPEPEELTSAFRLRGIWVVAAAGPLRHRGRSSTATAATPPASPSRTTGASEPHYPRRHRYPQGERPSRKRSRSFQRQALHRGDRARPHALGAHLGAPALRRRQQPRLPGRSLSSRPRGDIESVLERYMISPLPDRTGGPGGLVELPRPRSRVDRHLGLFGPGARDQAQSRTSLRPLDLRGENDDQLRHLRVRKVSVTIKR